jgi:GT2 family glycosyltransferase
VTSEPTRAPSEPSISILVPSYNPGKFLPLAINSALDQIGSDDEILVQDAVSTDGTVDYLRDLAALEPRVKPVVGKDRGQSDALNLALKRAKNPWVLWLNADDVVLPSALDALRAAVRSDPDVDLVIGASQIHRVGGSVVDTFDGRPLNVGWMVKHGCAAFSGSILMRADFVRQVGGLEPELHTVMDLSLQLRMAEVGPRETIISAPIGALRFHDTSKTATVFGRFVRESHVVRLRHAVGRRQRLTSNISTAAHVAMWPVFRLKLTPGYRAARRTAMSLGKG